MNLNEIRQALEAYVPDVAARYKALIRTRFSAMTNVLGSDLKGVYNHPTFARMFRQTIESLTEMVKKQGANPRDAGDYVLSEEKLDRAAQDYALASVTEYLNKVTAKLDSLENASVDYLRGGNLQISGTRRGHRIRLEQNMIVNVSSKGVLFNQWPARIYVDGKLTSEAAYKRFFGDANSNRRYS